MKACEKCGFLNANDCLFCERCGNDLTNTQDKRNVLWGLAVPILIAAALLFTYRDRLPIGEKKDTDIQKTVSEEGEPVSAKQQEKDLEVEEAADGSRQKDLTDGSQQEETADAGQQEGIQEKAGLDAELNGVDNAYVQAAGTILRKDGRMVLQMQESISVCAYSLGNEIVKKEKVEYLILDGEDTEEYAGSEVEIKGSLTAENAAEFCLRIVKVDIKKEADQTETAQGEKADFGNHQYYLVVDDVTWQEAFDDCINRGGYLAQINSEEEFQSVIQMIENENKQNIHFYLGGRREESGREYRWVNAENQFAGDMLNPEGMAWTSVHWMENEPSFVSEEENEMFMNLIYYKECWVLNDVPMDITQYYPGKTGYICEIDE